MAYPKKKKGTGYGFLAYVVYSFAKTHLRIDANAIKAKKQSKAIISIQQETTKKESTENQEHDTQTGNAQTQWEWREGLDL